MKEIIKRLEIIKSSLAIEDLEIIQLQANRLRLLSLDDNIKEIVTCIDNGNFGKVLQMIEEYLGRYNGVTVYEDKELHGLRIELKVLERTIQELSETKTEYLRMLHEFHAEYNRRLGHLIKRLLHLREERLAQVSQQDSSYQEAFQEAKADSAKFEKEYEESVIEPAIELSKEEREELKKLYRTASRMCHPDTVEENQKQRAEEIFKALSTAYQKGDLEAVKKILEDLQSGESFAVSSDIINDKELLSKKITSLKAQAASLKAEIEEIESDKTFKTLCEIKDFDEYFGKIKVELITQIDSLEGERATMGTERL